LRFLLVDRICEMVPGKSIRAEKTFSADEEFFRDHFPGFPVVPGVLLTEVMGQTAGKCLDAEKKPRGKAMLMEIKSARFRGWVRPDELMTAYATITSVTDSYATSSCHLEVNGERKCSAEIRATFVPPGTLGQDFRDEVLERYLTSMADVK
jgi:3-hydroxyacyl-[acyl-carrier-protein] dehydratase